MLDSIIKGGLNLKQRTIDKKSTKNDKNSLKQNKNITSLVVW